MDTLDTTELEQRVQQIYHDVAVDPARGFHFDTGRALAERLGYPPADLDQAPAAAVDSFAGVGYFFDLAAVRTGETVLDLGSGAGMDSFLAAAATGPTGRVIGVDMTAAQQDKATRLATAGGIDHLQFHLGRIEHTPVADGTVDVAVSNGVINLAPDKAAVFREIARALRPGGRLALADIVTTRPLPAGVTCDASLWAACIGGAMQIDSYQEAITDAGLHIEVVRGNDQYQFRSAQAAAATEKWGVRSISLLARRG